ncbi:MAG: LD-carboxypeptidase [Fimbriimonadaceae bacterium]
MPIANRQSTINKPRALTAGSTIRIVSPASAILPEKTELAAKLLEDAGYRVEVADHAFDKDHFLAGNDQVRAADLQSAFADPAVDAVYCSRGGYGCARLLPYLDLDRMAAAGKLFLGFSDITTLHLALNRRGLPTVHSPMAYTFSTPREAWVNASFLGVLRGETDIPEGAPRGQTIIGGIAEGIVTGGCLCLITDAVGTADAMDAEGKIVLIEDVDEDPHRIDAMLTHLLLIGALEKCAGIVIGEMTRSDEAKDESIGGKPWLDIVLERLEPIGKPMIVGYPFGHMKQMLSLPLGIMARLDADAGTLDYLEPLCS